MTLDRALQLVHGADASWHSAFVAHLQAEPDAEFASRLRALSAAAAQEAEALSYADEQGLGWTPLKDVPRPPAELGPDARAVGPRRVGAADAWKRFDVAYAAWERSMHGEDLGKVVEGFRGLSEAAAALAMAVDEARGTQARTHEQERHADLG